MCCFLVKKKKWNITLSLSIKEIYELIEHTVSQLLMSDHSVAIKHFVSSFSGVLSARLIQSARLISS